MRRRGAAASSGHIEQVLAQIPLIPPWTVDEFCAWVEERYDREIKLSPWQTEAPEAGEPGSCGLLWVTRDAFIINYDDTRSERHQRQQIFHEIGHILCDHRGDSWNPEAMKGLAEGSTSRWSSACYTAACLTRPRRSPLNSLVRAWQCSVACNAVTVGSIGSLVRSSSL